MNRIAALLLALALLLPCGCSQKTSGYAAELTDCGWSATLGGGGKAALSFSGDHAALTLENGGEREEIWGRFVADEERLIIFDSALPRSYCFAYVPKGDSLDLTYGDDTITLYRADSQK